METHEKDGEVGPQSRPTPAHRPAEAVEAASQAIAARRPDVLGPSGLMHLQKTAGNAGVNALLDEEKLSPVKDVVGSGGGVPLDPKTRAFMEPRLGADFGDVRVHTDAKATESARSVNAHAYTVGKDVVFQSDQYSPTSDAGRRMLAHELTHVVQQKAGPVSGSPAPGGINVSHPSDAFEQAAERSADRVMATPTRQSGTAPTMAAGPAAVQRAEAGSPEEEQEEKVQGSFVQRADNAEEKEEETA